MSLLEALVRESPGNRDYRCSLADSQNDLGVYFEGFSTTLNGNAPTQNLAESERCFQRCVETLRGLLGPTPSSEDLKFRIRLATSLHNVADAAVQAGNSSGVLGYYAESHQLLIDVLKLEPNNEEALMALGITLLDWGSVTARVAATRTEGERLVLKAVDTLKPLVQREPTWAKPRFFLGDCYRTLGQSCDADGRFAEALRYWEACAAMAEGDHKAQLQCCQALDLARLGDHRKAWELVGLVEPSLTSLSQHHSYAHRLVAACSSCIAAAEKDQSIPPAERAALCVKYGDKGSDLLRRVLELAPVADRPARRNELRENKDMSFLLRRTEVKSLLADATTSPEEVKRRAVSTPRGNK